MNPQTPVFDLHEGSGGMLYVVTNVTSSENITDMLQKAKEKFGKMDILWSFTTAIFPTVDLPIRCYTPASLLKSFHLP